MTSRKMKLTPLEPFLSFSSMNKDKYSGDLLFKFKKCSKSCEKKLVFVVFYIKREFKRNIEHIESDLN